MGPIDGRNRLKACELAGVKPHFAPFKGDALKRVVSANLRRRHLNESQRAMIVERIRTTNVGAPVGNKNSSKTNGSIEPFVFPVVTREKACEALNVSPASAKRAAVVLDRGTPELIARVDSGQVSVSKAARVATLRVRGSGE